MHKMLISIRHRYQRANTYCQNLYNRALQYTGLHDCAEMRITAAVAVCVLLYYLCALLDALLTMLNSAAHTLTAIVHS